MVGYRGGFGLLALFQMSEAEPLVVTEEDRMNNPEYFRLIKDGSFVGFKRVVTEYLPAGYCMWQLDEEAHDETQKLSKPGVGIENLKRASLSKRNISKLSISKDANENRTN